LEDQVEVVDQRDAAQSACGSRHGRFAFPYSHLTVVQTDTLLHGWGSRQRRVSRIARDTVFSRDERSLEQGWREG
ncbi:MAG TPA: hypothetical protein VGK67_16520, partial [Myxococcales bacterium]